MYEKVAGWIYAKIKEFRGKEPEGVEALKMAMQKIAGRQGKQLQLRKKMGGGLAARRQPKWVYPTTHLPTHGA